MSAPHIRVRYHSIKMFMTVDLNTLMQVLLERFGPQFTLEVQPMTESEVREAEEDVGLVTAVRSRFTLSEERPAQSSIRHKELEEQIQRQGRK